MKRRAFARGIIKPNFEPSKDKRMSWYRDWCEDISIKDLLDGADVILRKAESGFIDSPAIKIQIAMHWGLGRAYSIFDFLLCAGLLEPYEDDENFDAQKWVEECRRGFIIERKQKARYKVLFSRKTQVRKTIKKYLKNNPGYWIGDVGVKTKC